MDVERLDANVLATGYTGKIAHAGKNRIMSQFSKGIRLPSSLMLIPTSEIITSEFVNRTVVYQGLDWREVELVIGLDQRPSRASNGVLRKALPADPAISQCYFECDMMLALQDMSRFGEQPPFAAALDGD